MAYYCIINMCIYCISIYYCISAGLVGCIMIGITWGIIGFKNLIYYSNNEICYCKISAVGYGIF